MVLHKHGETLYRGLRETQTEHLRAVAKKLDEVPGPVRLYPGMSATLCSLGWGLPGPWAGVPF